MFWVMTTAFGVARSLADKRPEAKCAIVAIGGAVAALMAPQRDGVLDTPVASRPLLFHRARGGDRAYGPRPSRPLANPAPAWPR